jgi:hypothetical protein
MDPDQEWMTWRRWLGGEPKGDTIYAQVAEMLAFRQIWDGFAVVHDNAPTGARKNATFLMWLRWNYARSQGMAVRRQTDPRSDVVSLARLVDNVWRFPTVLTRERFLALQGDDDIPLMDRGFDDLAGTGEFIDPRIPAQDFADLQRKTARVRKWVNTSVAHLTAKGSPSAAPPLQTIHDSVEEIFALFVKYMNLIHGVHVASDVVMSPWPSVFRVPWIPDDDHYRAVWTKITEAETRRREG